MIYKEHIYSYIQILNFTTCRTHDICGTMQNSDDPTRFNSALFNDTSSVGPHNSVKLQDDFKMETNCSYYPTIRLHMRKITKTSASTNDVLITNHPANT